jgi:hypothetical protein
MAMSWWARNVDPAHPPSNFCSAIADLKWVLEQLNKCLASPPSPSRSSLGKRHVKLTERAAEGPSQLKKMFTR